MALIHENTAESRVQIRHSEVDLSLSKLQSCTKHFINSSVTMNGQGGKQCLVLYDLKSYTSHWQLYHGTTHPTIS